MLFRRVLQARFAHAFARLASSHHAFLPGRSNLKANTLSDTRLLNYPKNTKRKVATTRTSPVPRTNPKRVRHKPNQQERRRRMMTLKRRRRRRLLPSAKLRRKEVTRRKRRSRNSRRQRRILELRRRRLLERWTGRRKRRSQPKRRL